MPNMNTPALIVWDKKIFKVFSLCCHGNQSSSLNSILWSILKEHDLRIIFVKFDWILIISLGDFFVIVNRRTDRRRMRPITILHLELFVLRWDKKIGQCRSAIRLRILCSLILICTVHKSSLCCNSKGRIKNKKSSLNSLLHNPDFLTDLKEKAIKNIVGKEENTGNQDFLQSFSHNVFYLSHNELHFLVT